MVADSFSKTLKLLVMLNICIRICRKCFSGRWMRNSFKWIFYAEMHAGSSRLSYQHALMRDNFFKQCYLKQIGCNLNVVGTSTLCKRKK